MSGVRRFDDADRERHPPGEWNTELFRLLDQTEECRARNESVRAEEVRPRGSILLSCESVYRSNRVRFAGHVAHELGAPYRSIDANADDQSRSRFTPRGDVALPPERRVYEVAHVSRARDAVGQHQRAREIGKDPHERMYVHVPQARDEELPPSVEHAGSAGNVGTGRGPRIDDAIALDDHGVVGPRRTGDDVDHRHMRNRDRRLLAAVTSAGGKERERDECAS